MPHTIEIAGETLPVHIRKHKRSRRMILRYAPRTHSLSLTLPPSVSVKQGLSFVMAKRAWIKKQITEKPQAITIADGAKISVLGHEYTLRHVGGRGLVRIEGDCITVPGEPAFMARRVREWLINIVAAEIQLLVRAKTTTIGKRARKISLRDTHSLWGSCNNQGHLSFCWRLVFAPREVLDYVVSHEVAHLMHLDHSPAFWALVERLCPHHTTHRRWLKTHGAALCIA